MNNKIFELDSFLNSNYSRRDFIITNVKKLGVIALGTYTISIINSCSDDSNPTSPNGKNVVITIDITQTANKALQTIGGTVAISGNELDSKGMLIVRQSESNIVALSRKCTHQGCTVPNFVSGISTCPCHGSQYDTNGNVVKGPAPKALTKYNAVLEGNIITIS